MLKLRHFVLRSQGRALYRKVLRLTATAEPHVKDALRREARGNFDAHKDELSIEALEIELIKGQEMRRELESLLANATSR